MAQSQKNNTKDTLSEKVQPFTEEEMAEVEKAVQGTVDNLNKNVTSS